MKLFFYYAVFFTAFSQEKTIAEDLYLKGYQFFKTGNVDSSIFYLSRSVRSSKVLKNDTMLIKSYQALSDIYSRKGDFTIADSMLTESNFTLKKLKKRSIHLFIKQQQLRIVKLLYQTKLDDAITEVQSSNRFIEKKIGTKLNRSYLINQVYLGNIYGQKGEYEKASLCFEFALEIAKKILKTDDTLFSALYNNLGVLYKYIGDPHKALEFYLKALSDIKKYGIKNISEGMFYNNIGIIYSEFGDFEQSEKMLKNSLKLFKKLGNKNPDIIRSYAAIGESYYNRAQYESANDYLQKAYNMGKVIFKNDFKDRDDTILRIAKNFEAWSKIDSARYYFHEFTAIKKKTFGIKNPAYLLSLIHLANFYVRINDFRNLKQYLKTIQSNIISSNEPMYEQKILFAVLHGDVKKNDFKTGNNDDWYESFKYYNTALLKINKFYEEQTVTMESKYIHSDFVATIYDKILSLLIDKQCPLNSKKSKLLISKYIEYSKSNIFVNNLENQKILKEKLGSEKFKVFQDFKTKIDSLELENTLNYSDERQSTLFYLKRDFAKLSAVTLENMAIWDKTKIEKNLKNNETVLSYYDLGNKLIVQIINSNGLDYIIVPYKDNLDKLIQNYLTSINKRQKKKFKRLSNQLYDILIRRLEPLIAQNSKIIVIPHKLMYYVPFETLMKDKKYLIENYEVMYSYSYRFYFSRRNNGNSSKKGLLAFAPVFGSGKTKKQNVAQFKYKNLRSAHFFNEDDKLAELPESENEVKEVSKMFLINKIPAELFLRSKASKKHFIDKHSEYNYIHLATHGFINERKPSLSGLFFYKEEAQNNSILYTSESYNLKLNAKLLVLSSCESGLGKSINGEGILSISKGFLYSGTQNVIQSLWKVFDKHTKDLMVEFYKQHLNGFSISKSLQIAKLKLISKDFSSFPKNWGGFVLVGSQSSK